MSLESTVVAPCPMRAAMLAACSVAVMSVSTRQADAIDGGNSVLVLCSDEILAGEGDCASFLKAFREEMANLDLVVIGGAMDVWERGIEKGTPPEIVEATKNAGASCTVWTDSGGEGTPGFVLSVYSPGSVQAMTVVEPRLGGDGKLDLGDAIFQLRSIIVAALFLDLPDIVVVEEPSPPMLGAALAPGPDTSPAPAVAEGSPPLEGHVESSGPWVRLASSVRRPWVKLAAGYALTGYPIEGLWYHGAGFSVAVMVLPSLELFVDAAVTAPRECRLGSTLEGDSLALSNSQYIVGLGLGWKFSIVGPVALVPLVGFHLGISDSLVRSDTGRRRYREPNTAVWTGFDMALAPARWIALTVGFRIENLFSYEHFVLQGTPSGDNDFSLSQLRLQINAGLAVSF